ncbi:MAG TPA: strawberry notch family protein, partial [bacterium]|nr:strawberry notch family protein [bacterium]
KLPNRDDTINTPLEIPKPNKGNQLGIGLFDTGLDLPTIRTATNITGVSEEAGISLPTSEEFEPGTVGSERHRPSGDTNINKLSNVEFETTKLQTNYIPLSESTNLGVLTPSNILKSEYIALTNLVNKVGNIDNYVANKLKYKNKEELFKYFAGHQIDAIALAIDAIDRNSAFIIGDQTGVGKGRVIAAVIKYSILINKKPIFFTVTPKLFSDMYRDLQDIGFKPNIVLINSHDDAIIKDKNGNILLKPLNQIQQTKLFKNQIPYDVIFTTYSQFTLSPTKKDDSIRNLADRYAGIKKLAKDNILILDESHSAAGVKQLEEDDIVLSNTGQYMFNLISSAKSVIYSSATYAKRAENMIIYSKTTMGKANNNLYDFIISLKNGGTTLQQWLSNILTQSGEYVRRELDWSIIKRFETLVDKTQTEKQIEIFNKVSEVFYDLFELSNKWTDMVKRINIKNKKEGEKAEGLNYIHRALEASHFGSKLHNYASQLLLALKLDQTIQLILKETVEIEKYENRKKIVINLSSTMGSFIQQYAQEHNLVEGDIININFGDSLIKALNKTLEYKITDEMGNKETVDYIEVLKEFPELQEYYDNIKEKIENLNIDLPISPIDYLKQKLKENGLKVDEITGRNVYIDYSNSKSPILKFRSQKEKDKNNIVNKFNNGITDVLIINVAGSTGLSLHSSEKFKDQRQRLMLILQPDLNIDVFMQALGRVFRTGQVIEPEYVLIQTELPADQRPLISLIKKMSSLNANTSSNVKGNVNLNKPDMFNSYGDLIVIQFLKENLDFAEKLDINISALENEEKKGEKNGENRITLQSISGKIIMLNVEEQERFYEYIENAYTELINYLDSIGENNLEVKNYDFKAKTIKKELLIKGLNEADPFQSSVYAEEIEIESLKKPFNINKINDFIEKKPTDIESLKKEVFVKLKNSSDKIKQKFDNRINKLKSTDIDLRIKQNLEDNKKLQIKQLGYIGQNILNTLDNLKIKGTYKITQTNTLLENTSFEETGVLLKIDLKKVNTFTKNNILRLTFAIPTSKQILNIEYNPDTYQLTKLSDDIISDWTERINIPNYERKVIITGNMLKAFSKYKGQLINYTVESGEIKSGILLPKNAEKDLKDEINAITVKPNDILNLINSSIIGNLFKFKSTNYNESPRKGVYIENFGLNKKNLEIIVPLSKGHGSKYYLDKDLLKTTKNEFIKRNNTEMRAVVSSENYEAFFKRLNELNVEFKVAKEIFDNYLEEKLKNVNVNKIKNQLKSNKGSIINPLYVAKDLMEGLYNLSLKLIKDGYNTLSNFSNQLKFILGNLYNKINTIINHLFNFANSNIQQSLDILNNKEITSISIKEAIRQTSEIIINDIQQSADSVIDALTEKNQDNIKIQYRIKDLLSKLFVSGVNKIKDVFNSINKLIPEEIRNKFPKLRRMIINA